MTWMDVTQPLYNGMPVWPGDMEYCYQLTAKKVENGVVNVGHLSFSTHAGTHVDAPFHYDDAGQKIHDLDVSLFIGKARVIYLPNRERIRASDLAQADLMEVERLLIRTDSVQDKREFSHTYTFLDPDVGPILNKKGIKVVGVDVPSVDFVSSKTLNAHHSLHRYNIHIIENLVLEKVDEGVYDFIALPLPVHGGDGCPVRAVLRKSL